MPKKTKVSEGQEPIKDGEKVILCQLHEQWTVTALVERKHPLNRNRHPMEQIERLAKIMRENGVRHPIVISTRSGKITKGHGRLEAALFNSWKKFPVQYQHYESDEAEYADLIADNAIALWSELDLGEIHKDLENLDGADLDIEILGIKGFQFEPGENKKEPRKLQCPKCYHTWEDSPRPRTGS